MEYIGGRHDRILSVYNSLIEGAALNTKSAADYFGVSTKTIRRDIDDIRSFLAEKGNSTGVSSEVVYDRAADCYKLIGHEKLTSQEVFAVCKVLLESRAFSRSEFMPIMEKLIERCSYDSQVSHIRDMVANEKYHYCEPCHKKPLINMIWDISYAVQRHKQIMIKYERLTEPRYKERVINPVGIMFSDYYFYLAAFIPEKNTKYPTIYRLDRFAEYKILKDTFHVPYANRFEEGEFRKRIQFMYGGELMRIEFKYFGESVEAILDRLPTAEIINEADGVYTFKAEVFGRGIKPWILSQADKIEVIKPAELRQEIAELVDRIRDMYG